MELVNSLYLFLEGDVYAGTKKEGTIEADAPAILNEVVQGTLRTVIIMLAPFAPYLAHELWESVGENTNLLRHEWLPYNTSLAKEDEITYAVQINGKLRSHVVLPADSPENAVRERALEDEKVRAAMEGKQVAKVIVIAGKLVNVVVK